MATTTKLLRAEDLLTLPSDLRCELVDGVLIELSPPAPEHGGVTATFTILLGNHVHRRQLGRVMGEVGFILRRNPDLVRAPDVAFVRADRIPASGLPRRSFWELAPDLVVEVISPDDRPGEIQVKVREWLEGGARLVLVAYPPERSVHHIRSLTERLVLGPEDTLDLDEVIAGFSCRVADIFE